MKIKNMASVYIYQTYLQTKYKLINPKRDKQSKIFHQPLHIYSLPSVVSI